MQEFERKYSNINVQGFEGEAAKIMQRYALEGRTEAMAPSALENRKQVRFEAEGEGAQAVEDNRV